MASEDEEWEDIDDPIEEIGINHSLISRDSPQKLLNNRCKNSSICPIYNEAYKPTGTNSQLSTMERTTQTEPPRKPKWKQMWLCFLGDENFRKERAREASCKLNFSFYFVAKLIIT